jgi:hypothetical protein
VPQYSPDNGDWLECQSPVYLELGQHDNNMIGNNVNESKLYQSFLLFQVHMPNLLQQWCGDEGLECHI